MEEELKQCWRETSFRQTDSGNKYNRRQTALKSLEQRYKRFSNLGLVFTFVVTSCLLSQFYRFNYFGNSWLPIVTIIFAALYFALASVMDRWLYKGISRIDLSEMSVTEVCRLAFYYRKKHLQFIAILLPMAIALIGAIIWIYSGDVYFIIGIVVGGIIGLLLGTRQFLAFMAEYKDITEE